MFLINQFLDAFIKQMSAFNIFQATTNGSNAKHFVSRQAVEAIRPCFFRSPTDIRYYGNIAINGTVLNGAGPMELIAFDRLWHVGICAKINSDYAAEMACDFI